MNVIDSHIESERLILSQVEEIEAFYYFLIGDNGRSFTDDFRMELRGIVRQYGIDSVVESMKEIVNKYGSNGLGKLIAFVICKNNPKTKWKYIYAILKKRIGWSNVDAGEVESLVAKIVDVCGNNSEECLNFIIKRIKRYNFPTDLEYASDMWAMAHDFRQVKSMPSVADSPHCLPMTQAASGGGVPGIIEAYQASIGETDGSPANVRDAEAITILKEIRDKMPTATETESEPAGKKRSRRTVTDAQYHRAIKMVIDARVSQSKAEDECGLWRGALSTGKGAKMLADATSEVSRIEKMKVSEDVGDDYYYNEVRNNEDD